MKMQELIRVTLQNEMDLILAHKRSMRLAELAGLSLSAQTTFATAVSEVARNTIEHGKNGCLALSVSDAADGASIAASILVPVIATVNTSDLADGTAIAITGEGTATASMAVADVADGTSITGYTTLTAQIAVNDSADGSAIQGAGQLWLPVVLTPTSWVNVNA